MSGEIEPHIEDAARAIHYTAKPAPPWSRISVVAKDYRRRQAMEVLATSAVSDAFRDAARLRSLAATFDATPDATFTGAQVAAKLRGDS